MKSKRINIMKIPARHGLSWYQAEVDMLKAAFTKGIPIEQIAARHKRSIRAIQMMVDKLGLAPADTSERIIINGEDYTYKFELASAIVEHKIECLYRLAILKMQQEKNFKRTKS